MIKKIILLMTTLVTVALAQDTDANSNEWSEWAAISPTCSLVGLFGGWLDDEIVQKMQ